MDLASLLLLLLSSRWKERSLRESPVLRRMLYLFYRAWLAGEEEQLRFWCSTVPPLPNTVASASNAGIVGRVLAMQAVERWCSY